MPKTQAKINSITEYLATFYLILKYSHRKKSFVSQSKFEIWLLAIIVRMQTEKIEKSKNCFIYRCS
jgi:hypothetical protein